MTTTNITNTTNTATFDWQKFDEDFKKDLVLAEKRTRTRARRVLNRALQEVLRKENFFKSSEGHIIGHVKEDYDPAWYAESKYPAPEAVLANYFGNENVSILEDSELSFIIWMDNILHDENDIQELVEEEERAAF